MVNLFRDEAARRKARSERELQYGRITDMEPRPGHPEQYVGRVIPPPEFLTPDQLDLFDALTDLDRLPGGEFTSDQVRNWTALGFRQVCQLEGVGHLDAANVLAEIDLRWGGHWPGHWSEPRWLGPAQMTLFG